MKKLCIILGIISILLLSGCLDDIKTNVNVNGENDSVDTNHTTNSTGSEDFTYPVGENITEDGKEVVS